jgi:hypothetical protein
MKSKNVLGQKIGGWILHTSSMSDPSSEERNIEKDSHVGAVMLRRNFMSKATAFIRQ